MHKIQSLREKSLEIRLKKRGKFRKDFPFFMENENKMNDTARKALKRLFFYGADVSRACRHACRTAPILSALGDRVVLTR